ncbi:agarase [Shewanella japonica]|uniref:agarase n=1 Tax=Shewanella japonica TaxID=93973 RepID=UPI002494A7D8|nr:agarase [Shewanella japonica]
MTIKPSSRHKRFYSSLLISSLLLACSDGVNDNGNNQITEKDMEARGETEAVNSIEQQKTQASVLLSPLTGYEDFSKPGILNQFDFENSRGEIKKIDDKEQLVVHLDSKQHHSASFSVKPDKSFNWQSNEPIGFAVSLANPKSTSVFIHVKVKDSAGLSHNRNIVLPAKSQDNYFMALSGEDLSIETGIRSNPNPWLTDYTPIIWRYGVKNIDLKNVAEIEFSVHGVPEDKQILLSNLQLIKATKLNDQYLENLVDEFGQSTKIDFINKVKSTDELIAISAKEQASLLKTVPEGRSTFNGWKAGPKLDATGYFRVEKYQGKWSLVDPEGYLFFSNGIANIRMANTSTITGYDFNTTHITPRAEGDFTPEDSIGLNRAPESAWDTRYVSSELRAKMFSWLPKYGEPLSEHFGYRREVHTGAVEKGETFSFYQANLARKYQSNDADVFMPKWRDTTVDRMLSWGFTSFGNWVDPSFYQLNRIPYFANGWIIGDFKTVSSGNDYWSPLPDPFDPEFVKRAHFTAKQIAAEVQNNPWCVGIFIDNEKSWGQMGSIESQYGLVINTLGIDASDSPTKAEFVKVLQTKYTDIGELNRQWGTNFPTWKRVETGIEITDFKDEVVTDLSLLLEHYTSEYFAVVSDAVAQYLPNHLYLGARFASWGMTPEVRSAAAKHVDVMSYNYYKESVNDSFWSFLEGIDMPSIIGEFHNGSMDSGLLNPGLIHASSQADRGAKYQEYVNSVLDNPYLVGSHWFQYIDSPLTGRAYDGENYNVGFVSVTDIPYQPLVDAAKAVNQQIYTRRFGDVHVK